jgi:uncharacterized damage-inducible protein DinB
MQQQGLLLLHDYNAWANARVLEAAAQVTPAQFTATAAVSFKSLRGTLVHVLSGERTWRLRCAEGVSPEAGIRQEEFPDLAALRDHWRDEEAAMRAFLHGLTDADALQTVGYTTTQGVAHQDILWHLIAHVVNHGTQFRGEAGALLADYGHSPGDLDLILYLRSQRS